MVGALAWFEGRHMLTHPVVWLGALTAVALSISALVEEAAVLNRVSVTLGYTVFPIAVAVALVAGWAVLRTRGRSDDHPPAVMPVPIGQRVGGIVLGLLFPAVATFALQLAFLAWTMTRDPVTSLVWPELLVGPAFVVFAGAVSAALTRWFPHPVTPLTAVLLLAIVEAMVTWLGYDLQALGATIGPAALAPIQWAYNVIPQELAFRPSGLHLGYLAALTVVAGGVASIGRRTLPWALATLGVVTAVALGAAQLGPIDEERRLQALGAMVGGEAELTCESQNSIRFCAMPGYEAWIDDWAAALQPLLEVAPPELAAGIEVRQYPVDRGSMQLWNSGGSAWWWVQHASEDFASREVVPVGHEWGRWSVSDLRSAAAAEAMGCGGEAEANVWCEGESQNLITVWLLRDDPTYRGYFDVDATDIEYDATESDDDVPVSSCIVWELWNLPDGADRIRDNWAVLTAPDTTYEEAGAILGVDVPAGYDADGILPGGCP